MVTLIGSIKLFPYDFDPQGWKSCDGGEINIFDSETLFGLLGNTFGGDVDRNTFGVPNLKAPQGCRYCISLVGSYPQGRDDEALLGETVIWAVPTITPNNLVECKGQTLPMSRYMYLGTLIGSRFGAAPGGQFKLPDLQSRNPTNCRYVMCMDGQDPVGNMPWNPYVGEIKLLPYEPQEGARSRWQLCDGGQFSVNENGVLAHLLGKRFGGDGRVPDLRSAAPPNCNYYLALRGMVPSRS